MTATLAPPHRRLPRGLASAGGRLIWMSVLLFLGAAALNAVGTSIRIAHPFRASGGVAEVLSVVVGFAAELVLVLGLALVLKRRMDAAVGMHESPTRPRVVAVVVAVAVGTVLAILGGLLALFGWFTIAKLEQDYTTMVDVSRWNSTPIDTAVGELVVGLVVLVAALVVIRRRLRPRTGARFLWASALFFCAALAANGLGLASSTNTQTVTGPIVVLVSLAFEVPAVALLFVGLALRGTSTAASHLTRSHPARD